MEKLKLTCGACKNACQLIVEYEDDEVWDVTGNNCMKGMIFVQGEVTKNCLSEEKISNNK